MIRAQSDKFDGTFNFQNVCVTVCTALSLYNALELILLIFTTFKEYRGLYFWSLLASTFGLIPYCVGFAIEYFTEHPEAIGIGIDSCGWILLITGQSVVLYSRLNLVLDNRRIVRAVKWMIIVDALVYHSSTTVVVFGAHCGRHQYVFGQAYLYLEKIQMTAFCIQEFIISGLYVWKTTRLLKVIQKPGTRRVMWQLFTINVIIIIMDIGLLGIEYKDLHVLEQTFKSVIYSVKLKLEFAILGKLVELVQSSKRTLSNALLDVDTFVDDARTTSDLTRVDSSALHKMDSRPRWMADLEKSTTEHVEDAPHSNGHAVGGKRPSIPQQMDRIETIMEAPQYPEPAEGRRRTRTDSDLMYAEAMRAISL